VPWGFITLKLVIVDIHPVEKNIRTCFICSAATRGVREFCVTH